MAKLGISKILFKPLIFGVLSFFVIFFFFPSFGNEYLGVGYQIGYSDSDEKIDSLATEIEKKTGTTVDSLVDAANSDLFQGILDTGVEAGQDIVDSVKDSL